MHQQNESSESKVKFRQARNCCKRVFEALKFACTNKTKESVTSQKLGSLDFWRIAIVFSTRVNLLYSPLLNSLEGFSSPSGKAKLFAKNFSNCNLEDQGISLPVLPSRTNMKLHNISVTPKMVKKVITSFNLSKGCDPDCIPVVVLKNPELDLSYILAELFNMCLKKFCFPDCWKDRPIFKNVGKGVWQKTIALFSFCG